MWHWEITYVNKHGDKRTMLSPEGYETMLIAAAAWATQKIQAIHALKLLGAKELKSINVVHKQKGATTISINITK